MALRLDALTARPADLPPSKRGRNAEPLPENIVSMVKESYTLPEGQGLVVTLPRGDVDDNGKDSNVKTFSALLRRAAASLDYGMSITIGDGTKTQVPVTFRAKDKTKRRTKAEKEAEEYAAEVAAYAEVFEDEDFGFDTLSDYATEVNDGHMTPAMVDAWTEVFGEIPETDDAA